VINAITMLKSKNRPRFRQISLIAKYSGIIFDLLLRSKLSKLLLIVHILYNFVNGFVKIDEGQKPLRLRKGFIALSQ